MYFTVNQCILNLVEHKIPHEIIVVVNNSTPEVIEACRKLMTARDMRFHNAKMLVNEIPSNALGANTAALEAVGEYIAMMDSHVVIASNIFTSCINVLESNSDAGMVHAPISWTGSPYDNNWNYTKRCYEYQMTLERDFHGIYSGDKRSNDPYPIAMCGHGFYMTRKKDWDIVGGYHSAQRGYGGRETFLSLKYWLFGYRNFTDPRTHHIHYNGRRLYYWTSDMHMKNTFLCAYSIGGKEWSEKIYAHYKQKKGVKEAILQRLYTEAIAESQKEREFVVKNQKMTLDELIQLWKNTKVKH
jgi:GT2 family glycosyltransferase